MVKPKSAEVLVVEDDHEIRESMCDLLQDEGYQVAKAENGAQALDYLRAAKVLPGLILLDISMPDMDGYAFRAEQIQDPRIAGIPTAMVSADGHVKDKATKAGLVDYLRKPVDLTDLLALVGKHCHP
jgi:CheY-like chemotaxis protein